MALSPGEVTRLVGELRGANCAADPELIEQIYPELRRLASRYMRRERRDHTLQPTALVHEAYLRLLKQKQIDWKVRAHVLGVAAQLMRRILVDWARARQTRKRGVVTVVVDLENAASEPEQQSAELLQLDDALTRLEQLDAQQCRIVELRFFAGFSVAETAGLLGISERTVKRDWNVAKAWLHAEIRLERT
jgi:RNA polymerase sigma-70 factor, ECF subfamily